MILSFMRSRSRPLLVAAMLTTAACGGTTGGDSAPSTTEPESVAASLTVFATTSIWADIASRALCSADVASIIPIGSDPHSWEPSMATRGDLQSADLIIANGLDLEEGLLPVLDAVEAEGLPVLHMSDHIDLIGVGGAEQDEDHADDHDDHADDDHADDDHADDDHADEDHHHDGPDPHIWLDPIRVADALPAIVDAAVAAGGNAAELATCAENYAEELTALDAEITSTLAAIPPAERLLVTNHDALAYFADRYGFEIVGTVIPSTSTMAETNAADLAELAMTITDLGIGTVFTDAQSTDVDARALTERLDGVTVVPLLTGTLTSGAESGADYISLLRYDASAIAEALTP
ncbi:MAG: metal ABC transporter substrate-binding protein [Actinomycetota bacterium]|nr:metal ABC transporter substrate-binding protein [Actinomycetota bacterium]MDA3014047.1 metal ABC transporter substrate-binding protein [Actinomycetota bacterium]MDA3027385.1 metal ABC transporter substrate-binding protein [Actinomycetota bacterium]